MRSPGRSLSSMCWSVVVAQNRAKATLWYREPIPTGSTLWRWRPCDTREVLRRVREIPGIESAAVANTSLLSGG